MPLYTDSNYYYSGGSSQLYSPYYPGSSSTPSVSSIYSPYSTTYNRAITGTYVVPPTPRTASNYSALSSSRYQPKLTTITETSPLISSGRHNNYMPLTRIQSPKVYSSPSYSHTSTVHTPKYTPPRPILINTADIDVSANRYRKRKEEVLKQAQKESEYTSPSSSVKRQNSFERKKEEEERNKNASKAKPEAEVSKDSFKKSEASKDTNPPADQQRNRSTIKRNRAVVRLSTIRSRSKDRNKSKTDKSSSPEPNEKKFKDLPVTQIPDEEPKKWRQKLADDLASIPTYPYKKSPGDVLREKYLIQDAKDDEDYAAQCRAQRLAAGLPKETIEQVVVELDPLHHTVRRLSIPQCPTFHDICKDISSDKIDDDLNAGELRRRASIIQCQEQELLNQLQKSASGTFQMITLERRGSHDSVEELPHKRHSKRLSKKGKKVRTKITAIVEVENAPPLATIKQEKDEDFDPGKSPKPKFTVNVESVEEHHEMHKVFKLPKKKSVKKISKIKEQNLPDGFMTPLPKPQISPKKKFVEKKENYKTTAEIFTFDEKSVEEVQKLEEKTEPTKPAITQDDLKENKKPDLAKILENVEPKTPTTPTKVKALKKEAKSEESLKTSPKLGLNKSLEKSLESKTPPTSPLAKVKKIEEQEVKSAKTSTPKTLKPSQSLEETAKPNLTKTLEKSNSLTIELKTPTTPKTPFKIEEESKLTKTLQTKEADLSITKSLEESLNPEPVITLEKFNTLNVELKTPSLPRTPIEVPQTATLTSTESQKPAELKTSPKTLTTSQSLDNGSKTNLVKTLTSTEPQKSGEIKTSPKALTSSLSLDTGSKPSLAKTLEKSNSITVELKSPPVVKKPLWEEPTKPEEKKSLKTSQSLDEGSKPKLAKTLEKSNSITIELKTPKTPLTPDTIKEETDSTLFAPKDEPKVATPKPIRKAIKKSDSGEDFWSQIGTRETLYMNKRKQELVETQWKKRENLLESTNEEDVKNLEEIKTKVTSQKIEALKKSEQEQQSKGVMSRSNSNESALKKKTPTKTKEEKEVKEEKKKVSPVKKKKTPTKIDELAKTPLTNKTPDILKTNDKLENLKTPVVTKISQESSSLSSASSLAPSTPVTMANAKSLGTTTNTTTPTKITGHLAKSPEHEEQAEQNKFFPTTQAKNNNKNEIDINKTTTTTEQQLAKTFTLPTENAKLTMAKATAAVTTSAPTSPKPAEATATKQPETQQISKTSTELNNKNNAVTKPKTTDADNKSKITKTATNIKKTPPKTVQELATKSKGKLSPNAINADQFLTKVPIKTNTSPVKSVTSPQKTQTKQTNNAAPTKKTPDNKKTTKTTSTETTLASPKKAAATTPSATAATNINEDIRNIIEDNNNNNNKIDDDINNCTRGGNLSKFATVSNLAQYLQDVDADLADYIPSSAEISENDEYDSDSDFDYTLIDGWDKLTPSMKKKVKQRRRKEKQAEQARFDPQKKVKIDTTRKLFVKEEAPRFPLVATPRPLWKREKIIYPDEDSDDESDNSEESGSTEETDESDECTTSEEFEDDLSHPTASGSGGGGGSGGGVGLISPDPNKENSSIIRMSTCSNDSGFEGGTAPSSPKKMLECDVNCHKKCERLTANLCGVNQKLIVEALANVKRGARETRDSPSTPPSLNPAYKIEPNEEQDETSYTYSQFQKSGRFTPPATIIPRFKNYTVDDFHFLAVLGKGSFGKVLLAELRDTTYYYAVKCLKKDVVLEDDDVDSTLIERKVLALGTKHPYLCHLFCTFQTESHLFFVMEYLNGGDLMFHIQESGRFTEERARFYGAEIISGLKFLHKKGIIYRDLKLDNVLLDYEGHVRIADFGMCKLQIYLDKTADSFCGTPDYMAPEIIKGDKYNQNVDWWSFGVLLYEMLIGQSPFSGCDEDELFWSICNELPWFPVYISAEATGILNGLLEKDYMKRIGSQYSPAGDVVEHIFFRPIDWNLLEKRQIEPPFRPQVKHPLDTQYFDRVFTRERVRLTPIDKDILQSMDQKQFLGFTYTNPHITLD